MLRKTLARLLMLAAAVVLCTTTASAYLDPSAMSYLVQVLLGAGIAAAAALAIYWKKIRLFFKRRKERKMGIEPEAPVQAAQARPEDEADTIKIDVDSLDD